MKICNGNNCKAVNGKGHSDECIEENEKSIGVPSCFDRAERGGRKFDNCIFYNSCKDVKRICCNNPITLN